MIRELIRRIAIGLLAGALLATGASVFVLALAFAVYALAEPYVGRAGAASIVAGGAAVFIALVAGILFLAARPNKAKTPATVAGSIGERAVSFFREKPVVAISAALGAGFLAVRNPKYLGAVIRSFVEGREPPRPRK